MGTRGTFGVRYQGQDKLTYNHFDSYPDGLGVELLEDIKTMLKNHSLDWIKAQTKSVKTINPETKPTETDIAALKPYTDLGVSERSTSDWYCLTRKLQGHLYETLKAGYISLQNDFINDSLFCEWGYILNLDENTLEVYRGFQKRKHKKGRYANGKADRGYYPCALIATFDLAKLPSEDDFLGKLAKLEERE